MTEEGEFFCNNVSDCLDIKDIGVWRQLLQDLDQQTLQPIYCADVTVFQRTVDFIMDLKLDAAQFHILTPLPGSKLYRTMEREGRLIDRDWANYTSSEVVYQPKKMTPEELQQGYFWAFREIYSVKNILKRCLRSPRNLGFRLAMSLGYRAKAYRMPLAKNPLSKNDPI